MRRLVGALAVAIASVAFGCAGSRPRADPRRPLLPLAGGRGEAPAASASAERPAQADEAFRKTPPGAEPEVVFVPPVIAEGRLPNGIRLLVVERHELPIVAVQISVNRGADQISAGVGAFAGALLLSGTRSLSALALSDSLEETGGDYGASVDYDGVYVHGQVVRPKLSSLLDLLGDVIQHPAFASAEIERERARRLTAVTQQNDSPEIVLRRAALARLYPPRHPYRSLLLGEAKDLSSVRRSDIERFYRAVFRPDHLTISFAGDLRMDEAKSEATRVFGSFRGAAVPATTPPAPPPPPSKAGRFILVDRPGSTQSQVALALPGAARKTKDFDALLVMNTILGGPFSSRLNLNLREKHAYTYGAKSAFDFRHGTGPFLANAAVVRESTADSIREMLSEFSRMRSELVTPEELADAQVHLVQTLPARFESVDGIAGTLAALSVYGLPLDEFATRPARLKAITREDVKRVASTYLREQALEIVVVGDASVVKEPLKKLAAEQGLELVVERPEPTAPTTNAPGADKAPRGGPKT